MCTAMKLKYSHLINFVMKISFTITCDSESISVLSILVFQPILLFSISEFKYLSTCLLSICSVPTLTSVPALGLPLVAVSAASQWSQRPRFSTASPVARQSSYWLRFACRPGQCSASEEHKQRMGSMSRTMLHGLLAPHFRQQANDSAPHRPKCNTQTPRQQIQQTIQHWCLLGSTAFAEGVAQLDCTNVDDDDNIMIITTTIKYATS